MEQNKIKSKSFETVDSKYIQQHLANERTYLAWLRTAITIHWSRVSYCWNMYYYCNNTLFD
ncbi:DUF202 domain-containing protein [Bacillus cereus]|uniref:DUF202 domain-containing protein n=1 Tax=Bacillus cereus TaxID=1396 RepID=UPI003D348F57